MVVSDGMSKPAAAAIELLTLRANAPQFDPAEGVAGLPMRLLVLEWGSHQTTKGLVVCNETTMRELPGYNAAQNWDRPYLDYEHNTIPGSATYRGEPCDIAARSDQLELVAGEGVYYLFNSLESWTESGKKNAPAGNYPDLSPVVKVNERNEVIGLHSAALCRHGATPGLIFLSAAAAVKMEPQRPTGKTTPHRRLSTMDTPPQNAEELIVLLRSLLKLPAEATPAEVMEAFNGMLKAKPEDTKSLSAADAAELKTLSTEVKTLAGLVKSQSDTIKLLSAGHDASERGNVLAQAARDGKQVPKALAEKLDLANLKLLCAELPVTVPMDQRPEAVQLSAGEKGKLDKPELKALSAGFGHSDEDYAKYGKL